LQYISYKHSLASVLPYKIYQTPKQENFDSMVLTQKGLLISFDKYQVAPGSEGIVEILVPFKDLSEFLSPQMKELFQ
jgi:hypothetical protein